MHVDIAAWFFAFPGQKEWHKSTFYFPGKMEGQQETFHFPRVKLHLFRSGIRYFSGFGALGPDSC
jgi:hypothetical protein